MARPATRIFKHVKNTSKYFQTHVTETDRSHGSIVGERGLSPVTHDAADAQKERLQRLYSRVHYAVSGAGSQRALQFTHRLLTHRGRVGNAIRVEFIRLSIDRFLEAGDWDAAYSLYCRMRAEALPERGKVLANILEKSRKMPGTRKKVDQAIRDAANVIENVDEPELQAILAHLIRSKADIFVIREAIKRFQGRKGPKWRPTWKTYAFLAQAEAQNGYDRAAEEYFKQGRIELYHMKDRGQLTRSELRAFKEELYTNLFVGYAAFRFERPALFNALLLRMKKDDASPRQRIYNIIIALYAKKARGQKAFAFYRSMRLSDPVIPPNSTTFRHLFSLLLTPSSDCWTLKYNGRRLFRHMTGQHIKNTSSRPNLRSDVLDTSVLNAALLLFVWRRDYAAATVTMKTFPACSISPNARTHSSVVDPLLRRIRKELVRCPEQNVELWSDRMLGEITRLWDGAWSGFNLSNKLLLTVREFSTPVRKFSRSVRDTGVDMRMLLALLRRAIISSANLWPETDSVKEDALVNEAITRAYRDMVPKVF
jgi:pentatricopeptide repeat protein